MEKSPTGRHMAFILLDQAVSIEADQIVEKLRSFPGADASLVVSSSRRGDNALMIRCFGRTVVVVQMAAPLPRDEGIIERALLPEAEAVFDRHRAHIVVSTVERDDHPLPGARTITAVVGVLLASIPGCSAVLWNNHVTRSADDWLNAAGSAFEPGFPYPLWVMLLPFACDGGMGILTWGLYPFVGREIEFQGRGLPQAELLEKVQGLTIYVIDRGEPVPDGDTIGQDQNERIKVSHMTSERFPGVPVMFLA